MPKYKKISNNIEELTIDNPKTANKKLVWLNLINAGRREIEYLRKKYNFDMEDLRASSATTRAQRPAIEEKQDYLFLTLHFPVFKNDNIISAEVNFFVGKDYLITIHNNNLESLNTFFKLGKNDTDSLLSYKFESSAILLYELLESLLVSIYTILDHNSINIDEVEDLIFEQRPKTSVTKILFLKRNIINIRKILQNHKNTLEKLMEIENKLVPSEKVKPYYYNLLEHSRKIWQIIDNQKEMIDALYATNESLLNYKISDIMKTLTIFSVIVFPLTLLAAIFGMNTMNSMPFVESENGFWIIIGMMLLGCLGMLWFFERKKWL